MAYLQTDVTKVTTHVLQRMKQQGEKIAMLTAYDYSMAKLLDATKIDVVLVGDSAANVMEGYDTTLPISLDEMIVYASSVKRAIKRALVVVDMPFGTYQGNSKQALASAIRIMKETGADAVKLEGGEEVLESICRILTAGIPVMGHLGLTPQSINKFGTYAVRATNDDEAQQLIHNAHVLEDAGCFSVVLEKIPAKLAGQVTRELNIPTIGIGAGPDCDGQVLVGQDLLAMYSDFKPKFVKHYAQVGELVKQDMLGITQQFTPRYLRLYGSFGADISNAIRQYITDVKSSAFPNEKEQY